MAKLFIGNDQVVSLNGLRNGVTQVYINDAVATARLETLDGTLVANSDIGLAYLAGTDGDYSGQFEDTLDLNEGTDYALIVIATGGGLRYRSKNVFRATERSGF